MKQVNLGILANPFLFTTTAAWAQSESFVYPQKEQSKEQQQKDEYECYQWAKQQTGVDPMAGAPQAAPASTPKGGAVRGAAKGAAVGAIGGAIAGDAGKGAAIGAGVGAAGGGRQKAPRRAGASGSAAATIGKPAAAGDLSARLWGVHGGQRVHGEVSPGPPWAHFLSLRPGACWTRRVAQECFVAEACAART